MLTNFYSTCSCDSFFPQPIPVGWLPLTTYPDLVPSLFPYHHLPPYVLVPPFPFVLNLPHFSWFLWTFPFPEKFCPNCPAYLPGRSSYACETRQYYPDLVIMWKKKEEEGQRRWILFLETDSLEGKDLTCQFVVPFLPWEEYATAVL